MRPTLIIAFGAAIAFAASFPAQADPAKGAKTFEASKCTECHYTEGPAAEKSIDDQLAKKGPELWYAGNKFQKKWLGAWLQDPQPIRPLVYNSISEANPGGHAKLAAADAADVSDFLMSLAPIKVETGKVKVKKNLKGKLIFTKKMPCSGCHKSPGRKGVVSGGLTGPSLVGAKTRLNPDWIYAFLKTPKVFKPVKDMPNFVGILSDKDMRNVAGHVANFKGKRK